MFMVGHDFGLVIQKSTTCASFGLLPLRSKFILCCLICENESGPSNIFPLPSPSWGLWRMCWRRKEFSFLVSSVWNQAPVEPDVFPALLDACRAQLSPAFGCCVPSPALTTVVGWGAWALPRSLLPCTLSSAPMCMHTGDPVVLAI